MARGWLLLAVLWGWPAAGARADPPPPPPAPDAPKKGSGFRLEGQPAIEEPFGDADTFRRSIDRYQAIYDEMSELREDFSAAVQEVLHHVLPSPDGQTPRPKKCPEADVAAPFGRAHAIGQAYLKLGREIGRHFDSVRDLSGLGETDALTPDYRWKVKQILANHKLLLTDYREMKIVFHDQLSAEVRAVGCDPDRLVERARTVIEKEPEPAPRKPRKPEKKPLLRPGKPEPGPPKLAASVGFFIDNQRCHQGVRVYVDGALTGEVRPGYRGAFRTSAGPHEMCLIPGSSKAACGQPGTVRKVHISDGFTISMRCS